MHLQLGVTALRFFTMQGTRNHVKGYVRTIDAMRIRWLWQTSPCLLMPRAMLPEILFQTMPEGLHSFHLTSCAVTARCGRRPGRRISTFVHTTENALSHRSQSRQPAALSTNCTVPSPTRLASALQGHGSPTELLHQTSSVMAVSGQEEVRVVR